MFTYTFTNNTEAAISIKGKNSVNIIIPSKGSYVIKVGESCPIQYKVELHRAKKIYNLGQEFILALRKIHAMLSTVQYEYEIIENKVEEPVKNSQKVNSEARPDLATFKIIEFNSVMYVGKPEKILVQVDGDGRAISFKSSDKSIATVTRYGNVQPQAPGSCEITVSFYDISKVLKLQVLPNEELEE